MMCKSQYKVQICLRLHSHLIMIKFNSYRLLTQC
ncbi:hypothetical protein I3842_16G001400 [Carya illinoinensis]|uniref:Uncharacterized protein n=1 Tax=Carya illinoinensis TaxID=32201 RepID=A0A922A321_CARIL|nr:hypothetical protein I3842_16G001400 [Carya illinoinensis]